MASEPFFKERSDAVKMSETPYPGNGSGENLVEVARFKYSNLCTPNCPYRLAGSALPPERGQRTNKEERIHSFIILYMLLTISYAGFFAKSHMMFFLLSSFLFCPPLKNDGRVNCVSSKFLLGFCEKTAEWKPYAVPGHGEGGGEAVGRGKYEQKLKN